MPVHTGLAIRSNLLFGSWRLMGDIRSLYYPQYTWGLHGTPESVDRLLINYKYFRFYQTLFKKIGPSLFAGIGYHLDIHVDMDTRGDSSRLQEFTHYQTGAGGHLGFALFMNVNSIPEPNSNRFNYFHPAAGGGIRLKFSRLSTAKIALDCAFSERYAGIYLNLGDTF